MNDNSSHTDNIKDTDKKKSHRPRRWFSIVGIVLGALAVLVIILALGVTLWLTPHRAASLICKETAKQINGRLQVDEVRYSIWSSFPDIRIETDSVTLISNALPTKNDTLACVSGLTGSLNILKALGGNIDIGNVDITGLRVNLVKVNDTLANYNILKDTAARMPEIKSLAIKKLKLHPETLIKYESLGDSLSTAAMIDGLALTRRDNSQTYILKTAGRILLDSKGDTVFDNLPVGLGGYVTARDMMDEITLSDMSVTAGELKLKANAGIRLRPSPVVTRLDFVTPPLGLLQLLRHIPTNILSFPDGLSGNVRASVAARLLSPYPSDDSRIPYLDAELRIDNGKISIEYPEGNRLDITPIKALASLRLRGEQSDSSMLRITGLEAESDGLRIRGSASAYGITGDSAFAELDLSYNGDMQKLARLFMPRNVSIACGDIEGESHIELAIPAGDGKTISNPKADISIRLSKLSATLEKGGSFHAHDLTLRADASADKVSKKGIRQATLLMDIALGKAGYAGNGVNAGAEGLSVAIRMPKGFTAGYGTSLQTLPTADLSLHTRKGRLRIPSDTVDVSLGNTTLTANIAGDSGKASISVAAARYRQAQTETGAEGISATVSALSLANPVMVSPGPEAPSSPEDSLTLSFAPHTPVYVGINAGNDLQAYIQGIAMKLRLDARAGYIHSPAFPADNTFSGLKASIDNDSIIIHSLNARSGGCAASLRGNISNLRQFIGAGAPSMLKMRMRLDLDTLDINRIARIYENGVALTQGVAATLPSPKPTVVSRSDSMTLLVPRNLDAALDITARHLTYTDLDLTNVGTTLAMRNGTAYIDSLRMTAPFGRASIDFSYSTSDTRDIFMKANVRADSLDIRRFFDCYRNTLLRMMPYMSNFSGVIDAEADGRIDIFPSMFFNVPSLRAEVGFTGHGLTVRQNRFIRRITRMMLIRHSDPIRIPTFHMKGNIHDNLMELYPFDIEFDRYTLSAAGINNFDGDLFYHLGILKSPVPFPFGINVKGNISMPLLRFGGPDFKPAEGETVTPDIMEKGRRINLLLNLKYGFSEFLKKAASDDTSDDSDYVYPVKIEAKKD